MRIDLPGHENGTAVPLFGKIRIIGLCQGLTGHGLTPDDALTSELPRRQPSARRRPLARKFIGLAVARPRRHGHADRRERFVTESAELKVRAESDPLSPSVPRPLLVSGGRGVE